MLTTEARSLIPELKEQVENILNIISTTADPDVFSINSFYTRIS